MYQKKIISFYVRDITPFEKNPKKKSNKQGMVANIGICINDSHPVTTDICYKVETANQIFIKAKITNVRQISALKDEYAKKIFIIGSYENKKLYKLTVARFNELTISRVTEDRVILDLPSSDNTLWINTPNNELIKTDSIQATSKILDRILYIESKSLRTLRNCKIAIYKKEQTNVTQSLLRNL